jgi:hypothetical protein
LVGMGNECRKNSQRNKQLSFSIENLILKNYNFKYFTYIYLEHKKPEKWQTQLIVSISTWNTGVLGQLI